MDTEELYYEHIFDITYNDITIKDFIELCEDDDEWEGCFKAQKRVACIMKKYIEDNNVNINNKITVRVECTIYVEKEKTYRWRFTFKEPLPFDNTTYPCILYKDDDIYKNVIILVEYFC